MTSDKRPQGAKRSMYHVNPVGLRASQKHLLAFLATGQKVLLGGHQALVAEHLSQHSGQTIGAIAEALQMGKAVANTTIHGMVGSVIHRDLVTDEGSPFPVFSLAPEVTLEGVFVVDR